MKKINFGFIALFVVSVLLSFISAHTGDDSYGHHMTGGMMGVYGGGMWFGGVLGILIITVLILSIVWLVKQIQKK